MNRWLPIAFLLVASLPGKASGITYSFTPFAPLGADRTIPNAINDAGQVVGYYFSSSSNSATSFLYSAGTYTQILFPGSIASSYLSINNSGLVVGDWFANPGGGTPGGAFSYQNGIYTSLQIPISSNPNTVIVTVGGVNNLNQISGSYTLFGVTHLYEYDLSSGNFVSLATLPSSNVTVRGINDLGQIVGYVQAANSSQNEGFLYSNGTLSTFDSPLPGAVGTYFTGINDSSVISGFVFGPDESFLLDGTKPISNTNPISTNTDGFGYEGVNSTGNIVAYAFNTVNPNGYIGTSTPEPASMGLMFIGITAVTLLSRLRKVAANQIVG